MRAVWRFILDAIYVVVFAAVTAGGAIAFHYLAEGLEGLHVDAFIVSAFRLLGRILALIDVLGVICGSVFALYRFVKELANDC